MERWRLNARYSIAAGEPPRLGCGVALGEEAFVREAFELWWPRHEEKMAGASSPHAGASPVPSDRELLLETRRDVQRLA